MRLKRITYLTFNQQLSYAFFGTSENKEKAKKKKKAFHHASQSTRWYGKPPSPILSSDPEAGRLLRNAQFQRRPCATRPLERPRHMMVLLLFFFFFMAPQPLRTLSTPLGQATTVTANDKQPLHFVFLSSRFHIEVLTLSSQLRANTGWC